MGDEHLDNLALATYDDLLAELYDAAIDDHSWVRCLGRIRELFKANVVVLVLRSPSDSEKSLMLVSSGDEREGVLSYANYPSADSPFESYPVNQVFTVADVMSTSEWQRTAYYQDFCQPQDLHHVLGVNIAPPRGGVYRFRVTRPAASPDFSEQEKIFCEGLIPHLSRVLHIHYLLGRSESLSTLYSQTISRLSIATLVLDESGNILESNSIAREMLESDDGLKRVGNRLEATYPGDNKRLYQALRSTVQASQEGRTPAAEALSVSRPSGQVSLGLVIEPVMQQEWADGKGQPCIVVYVRDAVGKSLLSAAMTRQVFGFTPSESALAMELANGLSLEEAANSLNIRRNTARAHLRAIFSKTGVRRQTDLVRIILNSVVSLSDDRDQVE